MIEHKIFTDGNARAFTPAADEGGDKDGVRGFLAETSMGDWSDKQYRRLAVTGPKCTCTLAQPVGTNCARHS